MGEPCLDIWTLLEHSLDTRHRFVTVVNQTVLDSLVAKHRRIYRQLMTCTSMVSRIAFRHWTLLRTPNSAWHYG